MHNPLFDVTADSYRGVRITKVKELSTGREMSFMGALTKTHAINQFVRQIDEFSRRGY